MKKITALLLALMMVLSMSAAMAEGNPYAVTEPITIEWWHSNEDQYTEDIKKLEAMFEAEYPMIDVVPMYIGSGGTLAEQLIAAHAADSVPAVSQCNVGYLASYADSGVTTNLEPYFKAYGIDKDDFVKGYRASATLAADGNMYSFPFLASTQVIYYNKTIAQAEGIAVPTNWEDMDAFMEKATVKNADGTTARYAMVFGGWGSQYFETFFTNYGVEVVKEDGTCGVADDISIEITSKIKEWIDKGYCYWAYGSGASTNMRQDFWDQKVFAVVHTCSLITTYRDKIAGAFEFDIAGFPAVNGKANTLLSGNHLVIPQKASQAQKNAGFLFANWITSGEASLYWAEISGYMPGRYSAMQGEAAEALFDKTPAYESLFANVDNIQPTDDRTYYSDCTKEWMNALGKIFCEGAPVEATLEECAEAITEIVEDAE